MTEADLAMLRAAGFRDRAILDAVEIIGYFNYINRLADALGVDEETWLRTWERADLPPPSAPELDGTGGH